MQKLVFRNANGIELDLTTDPFGITEWEGFSADELNIQSQQVPFQDGGVFLDALLGERELAVTVAMYDGNDLEKRYRLRRQMISALNPKLGEGVLIYTNDFLSKQIHVIPQLPVFENHNSNDSGTPKVNCVFNACNPYWEDLEETVVEIKRGQIVDINNDGDIATQIIANIVGLNKNAVLRNITEEKQIMLGGTFGDFTINTNFGKKSVLVENYIWDWKSGGASFGGQATNGNVTVYAGDRFVCIKNENEKLQNIDTQGTLRLSSVAFGNGKFVGIGNNNISISSDGKNWNTNVVTLGSSSNSISFGDGKFFVASTLVSNVKYSTDGINWESKATVAVYDNTVGVKYINEKYIILGNATVVLFSTDLESWNRANLPSGIVAWDITYGKGKYILVGYINNKGCIYTSTDLTNWVQVLYFESITSFTSVSFGNNRFVAVGTDSTYATSTDGEIWETNTSELFRTATNIEYNIDVFSVIGNDGTILNSTDGENWLSLTTGIYEDLQKIKFIHNKYCCIGENVFITSNDEENWEKNIIGNDISLSDFVYNGDFIIAVGNVICTSNNETTWEIQQGVTTEHLNAIIYANGKYIAVGNVGTIITSTDGINWESQQSGTTENLYGVIYANGKYIAVGNTGTIITSTDTESWASSTSGVSENLRSISYGNEVFVVVGENGTIITSVDGNYWVIRTSGTSNSLYAVIYGLNRFIAVGSALILQSYDGVNWEVELSTYGFRYNSVCDNGVKYFAVGRDGVMADVVKTEEENIIQYITSDSDMSLGLQSGINKIKFSTSEGNANVKLTYRQKYIGV